MINIFDTLPFRIIRGSFKGLEDGMRGKVATNEVFSDGAVEEDTEKESAAGRPIDQYAGIRGGGAVGEKIGQWGGGLVCAFLMFKVTLGVLAAGAAAGVLSGIFPLVAAGALALGAGVIGGSLLGVVGKYAGSVVGMVVGGIGGAIMGAYKGATRTGYYTKKDVPEPVPMPAAPQPSQQTANQQVTRVAAPGGQSAEQPAQPMVIPENNERVQHILDNSLPPASKEDAALAANARVRTSWASKIGQMFSSAGNAILGLFGLKPAVDTRERHNAPSSGHAAPTAPRYVEPKAGRTAAFQQVDAGLDLKKMRQMAVPHSAVAPSEHSPGFVDRLNAEQQHARVLTTTR